MSQRKTLITKARNHETGGNQAKQLDFTLYDTRFASVRRRKWVAPTPEMQRHVRSLWLN